MGRIKMKLSVASLIGHIAVYKIIRKWCEGIYIIPLYTPELKLRFKNPYITSFCICFHTYKVGITFR